MYVSINKNIYIAVSNDDVVAEEAALAISVGFEVTDVEATATKKVIMCFDIVYTVKVEYLTVTKYIHTYTYIHVTINYRHCNYRTLCFNHCNCTIVFRPCFVIPNIDIDYFNYIDIDNFSIDINNY